MSRVRFDVVCVGEALVDFLPSRPGGPVHETRLWKMCPGGAPANVAIGVARLGGRSALAGVVGDDELGRFLRDALGAEGVDVRALRPTTRGKTGIGFVAIDQRGERSFIFYRDRSAESFLDARETPAALLRDTRIVHFGTNSLHTPRARRAVLEAARRAQRLGVITSCDPNLRLKMWRDPRVLQKLIRDLARHCAVMKLSDEEMEFVTGARTVSRALEVMAGWGVSLAVVTRGPRGAVYRFRGVETSVPAPRVRVVDTTGAGDGFNAGFLHALSRTCANRGELEAAPAAVIREAVRRGCRVGSRVVTRIGAVAGLPYASARRSRR